MRLPLCPETPRPTSEPPDATPFRTFLWMVVAMRNGGNENDRWVRRLLYERRLPYPGPAGAGPDRSGRRRRVPRAQPH